jgi:hypothetical protein
LEADAIKQKFHLWFSKNQGFKVIYDISCVGGRGGGGGCDWFWIIKDLRVTSYKYAWLVSSDVEHTFYQIQITPLR